MTCNVLYRFPVNCKTAFMKRGFWFFGRFCFPVLFAFLFAGCMKDRITKTYQIRTPVYESLSKYREGIKSQPPAGISITGKITVAGKYIYLSEPYKGIHVVDNSNPSRPVNVSFINIPGNEDMAVRGNTLYADAYGDLVTFDISDPLHVVAKNFTTNAFPDHSIYFAGDALNRGTMPDPDSINVIIGWTTRDTTVNYDPGSNVYPVFYAGCAYCASVASNMSASADVKGNPVGTNGSMARFSIINNYLYTVGNNNLSAFDISEPFTPAYTSSVLVDWHVETIYPLKDKLFVGTNNGMYMYDVLNSPDKPSLIGSFTHVRACDPVIADGDYAYVTLNDSSACLGSNNQLQIVDIKDLGNAYLVRTYLLTHPMGLSKDGNNLFVCDSRDGLKIFNASDVNNLQLIKQLKDAVVYDVIAENGLAIVVAADGLYQYDYSDPGNIHLISKL